MFSIGRIESVSKFVNLAETKALTTQIQIETVGDPDQNAPAFHRLRPVPCVPAAPCVPRYNQMLIESFSIIGCTHAWPMLSDRMRAMMW